MGGPQGTVSGRRSGAGVSRAAPAPPVRAGAGRGRPPHPRRAGGEPFAARGGEPCRTRSPPRGAHRDRPLRGRSLRRRRARPSCAASRPSLRRTTARNGASPAMRPPLASLRRTCRGCAAQPRESRPPASSQLGAALTRGARRRLTDTPGPVARVAGDPGFPGSRLIHALLHPRDRDDAERLSHPRQRARRREGQAARSAARDPVIGRGGRPSPTAALYASGAAPAAKERE